MLWAICSRQYAYTAEHDAEIPEVQEIVLAPETEQSCFQFLGF